MVTGLEELLTRANPVLDPEELRLPAAEADARCASILERRGAMQTQTPTPRHLPMREPTRPPRQWRKPAVAFGVAFVVVLVALGGIVWLSGNDGPDVGDEPAATTTTTAPPTTTSPTIDSGAAQGAITAPAYEDVPSFSGIVEYYEHDPATGYAGWQATVEIKHAGPMLYEATVLSGGPPYLSLPGSQFIGNGAATWLIEQPEATPSPISGFDQFSQIFYDSKPHAAWSEICADGTRLGSATLLGRPTAHIACSTAMEDYELWVDEETGIVLRLDGPLGIGDFSPYAGRDGGFVFTELTLGPVTITELPGQPAVEAGEFPPFHMVRRTNGGVEEVWYLASDTLRLTRADGGFVLVAEGRLAGCDVYEGVTYCNDVPLAEADTIYPMNGRPYLQLPVALVEDNCLATATEEIAGRPARRFACEDVSFPYTGSWYAEPVAGAFSELWFDVESSVLMKWTHAPGSAVIHAGVPFEVTLLEVFPAFPDGVFEFEEPPPASNP